MANKYEKQDDAMDWVSELICLLIKQLCVFTNVNIIFFKYVIVIFLLLKIKALARIKKSQFA